MYHCIVICKNTHIIVLPIAIALNVDTVKDVSMLEYYNTFVKFHTITPPSYTIINRLGNCVCILLMVRAINEPKAIDGIRTT